MLCGTVANAAAVYTAQGPRCASKGGCLVRFAESSGTRRRERLDCAVVLLHRVAGTVHGGMALRRGRVSRPGRGLER